MRGKSDICPSESGLVRLTGKCIQPSPTTLWYLENGNQSKIELTRILVFVERTARRVPQTEVLLLGMPDCFAMSSHISINLSVSDTPSPDEIWRYQKMDVQNK